ncbi:8083_t:CDS:2, partial [Scutellospora calospora]
MKQRKQLSNEERNQIICTWKTGVKQIKIPVTLKLSRSTINDVVTYYRKAGKVVLMNKFVEATSVEAGAKVGWNERKPKEKYDVECLVSTFRSGRVGVIVWGCFNIYGLGPLVQ